MTDEFSITLPSNVFSKEDPNNTPSKYVTRLSKTIQLSGAWEVAATRLQLQNRWYNFTKPQMLGVYVRDIRTLGDAYSVGTELRTGISARTEPSEEKQFNRAALKWKGASWATDGFVKNMTYRCVTFPAGFYTSLDHVGSTLCQQIMNAFENSFEDLDIAYRYIEPLESVQIYNAGDEGDIKLYVIRIVSLAGPTDLDVMEVLGFVYDFKDVFDGSQALYKYYGGVQLPSKQEIASMDDARLKQWCWIRSKVANKPAIPEVRQLMLYADVAALRNVGNIEAQLLDTVVVHAKFGEYEDALRGVTPNYVPVYRNTFSTIEIELTDYAGDRLRFPNNSNSPVIVTLRFRRVKSNK